MIIINSHHIIISLIILFSRIEILILGNLFLKIIKSDGKSYIYSCVHICVATKTITIKEDVYLKLVKLKRENESFNDLLDRLSESTNPLQLLMEMRGSLNLDDTSDILSEIRVKRELFR
jgi:predicted CopG family antitoxin